MSADGRPQARGVQPRQDTIMLNTAIAAWEEHSFLYEASLQIMKPLCYEAADQRKALQRDSCSQDVFYQPNRASSASPSLEPALEPWCECYE